MSMTTSECRFCALTRTPGEPVDTPWSADTDYFAIASVGALVEGWSLICSRKHDLNLAEHYKSDRFWSFATDAIDRVRSNYGPVVVFEHGAVFENSETSCGTAHAHLHVVPLSMDLGQAALLRDDALIWTECAPDQVAEIAADKEYLLVMSGSGNSTSALVAVLPSGRSQFFRRIIAEWLGRPDEYSYKSHPQEVTSRKTAIRLLTATETLTLAQVAA